ncbi:MAG: MG2 domain-containing protein, partial [Candidatus Edwardsbacteria bacterium]|nr:MG2 domain-containing protein [Candidatus Edwardsbacteria bacterium]
LEVKIPRSKERLQFVYRGRYLGREGAWNLPLKVSGIRKMWVNITYLPSDNVLFWHLRDAGLAQQIPQLGETVIARQEIPLEKGSKSNFVWINLREFLKSKDKGVYLVEVSGETQGHATLSDKIAVVISDLSIVLKWHNKNIYAWCFNSATLKPESGVEIEVRSSKNFVAGTGTTNSDGFCFISSSKEEREPYVVFARRGDEWTYVHVPTVRLPLEAYDIGGEDHRIPYLAYLYPERDLYRPGDVIHFGVIVRNNGDYRGASIPIKVKVRDPEGKDYIMLSGMTDENGFAEFSFPTAPSSPTGKYQLEVVSGDRTIYASGVFVEAFVPERMNVTVGLPDKIEIGEPFDLSIKADFLFGAPAAGERYSGKIKAMETPFTKAGYGNYSFGQVRFVGEKPGSWENDLDEDVLDGKGQARVKIEIDTTVAFNGPVMLEGSVNVTEGGSGRVTTRTVAKTIYTKPFYIGIKPAVSRIVPGQPVGIKGVLFRPDGSPYTGKAALFFRAYRLAYYYSYEEGDEGEYYGYNNWNAREKKIPVTPQKFLENQDGKFTCNFTPQSSYYDYLVEVVDENHQTVAEALINGWGWGAREQQQVESPEVVQLRLDKAEYDDGEQVRVEAQLPFEGHILWTTELDTIYDAEWRE